MNINEEFESFKVLVKVEPFVDIDEEKKWWMLGVAYILTRLQQEGVDHDLIEDIKIDAAVEAAKLDEN